MTPSTGRRYASMPPSGVIVGLAYSGLPKSTSRGTSVASAAATAFVARPRRAAPPRMGRKAVAVARRATRAARIFASMVCARTCYAFGSGGTTDALRRCYLCWRSHEAAESCTSGTMLMEACSPTLCAMQTNSCDARWHASAPPEASRFDSDPQTRSGTMATILHRSHARLARGGRQRHRRTVQASKTGIGLWSKRDVFPGIIWILTAGACVETRLGLGDRVPP